MSDAAARAIPDAASPPSNPGLTDAASPGRHLRDLINEPGCVVLPGVFDALTARLAERAGFAALYLTGSGVAYTQLGRADLGFVGLRDMVDRAWAIRSATTLPVLADADTGFGGPLQTIHTVRSYERAGLAGAQIEDQEWPKRCGHYDDQLLIPEEEMVAKVRAATDARVDRQFVIVARTDARRADGLTEAIRRARAFAAAGADVVFVEALADAAEMRAVTSSVGVPAMANMVEGGRTPLLSASELATIGYAAAIFPNAVARAVAFAAAEVLGELRRSGTTAAFRNRMLDFDELSGVVGLPEDLSTEARYAVGGRALEPIRDGAHTARIDGPGQPARGRE